MKQIFPEPPLASFGRPANLRDLLVHSGTGPTAGSGDPPGVYRCQEECVVCKFIDASQGFSSTAAGESCPIASGLACKGRWVICLIACARCCVRCVGGTGTALCTGFGDARSEIKTKGCGRGLPCVARFNSTNHSVDDISLKPIEQVHRQSRNIILRRESFWIAKLRTLRPCGIGVKEWSGRAPPFVFVLRRTVIHLLFSGRVGSASLLLLLYFIICGSFVFLLCYIF